MDVRYDVLSPRSTRIKASKPLATSIDGEALFSLARPGTQPPNQIIHLDRLALDPLCSLFILPCSGGGVLFEVASEGARSEERVVPAPADKGDSIGKRW